MTTFSFVVFRCSNPECGLRFTAISGDHRGNRCPACWNPTEIVSGPFPRSTVEQATPVSGELHLEVLLDNIRSAWNVGSMMRSSDGAGVRLVHLGGVTPGVDNPKIAKTSLGAETSVPAVKHADGLIFCNSWKEAGGEVWALEGGEQAKALYSINRSDLPRRLLLVVGNELTGVDPDILKLCDRVVFLPMVGFKGSLNVAVAFGIAVYTLRYGIK